MLCKFPLFDKDRPDWTAPCGQCGHCRVNKRRDWQHRMLLEQKCHEHSSFITLTMDDDNLPEEFHDEETGEVYAPLSVNPDTHRLFINNFRTSAARKLGLKNIRMFCAAEYGEKTQRPHFHYAMFGFPSCPYKDRVRISGRFVPCKCDLCRFTHDVWQKGHIFIGDLTEDSAQYIAGYVTKKMTNNNTEFQRDFLQGRHPEFARQSRMPGLGAHYIPMIAEQLTNYGILDKDCIPRALLHGTKLLPLGRYLSDKLYDYMGIQFQDKERQRRFSSYLRSLLHAGSFPSEEARSLALRSWSVAGSLSLLNSQKILNFESRLKMFSKEKMI